MAMLAERRERKRYNLVPRGKALYEDGNRFGTRMLEKMGWSKGKGLGAKENGDKEFVRIRYKHDNEGLGFEERDDQWTQHENEFNGLLKTLGGGGSGSENNSQDAIDEADKPATFGFGFQSAEVKKQPEKIAISGESLEEKSKKSKARVHYKKFTRSKDISRYSEKELANIFGKKSFESTEFPQIPEFNESKPPSQEASDSDEAAADSLRFGVTTINTGTSIADYFKSKMDKMRSKLRSGFKEGQASEHEEPACNDEAEHVEESVKQKSKKKKKKQSSDVEVELGLATVEDAISQGNESKKRKRQEEIFEYVEEDQPKEKRKKSKKNKTEDFNVIEVLEDKPTDSLNSEICTNDIATKLKPKKPKRKTQNIQENEEAEPSVDHLDGEIKPKKSKEKSETTGQEIDQSNFDGVETNKKDKKSKRKSETGLLQESKLKCETLAIEEPTADSQHSEIKPKKSKLTIETNKEIVESNAEIKSKKSKRKSQTIETEIEFPENDNSEKQTEKKPPFSKPPRNFDRVPSSLRNAIAEVKALQRRKELGNSDEVRLNELENNESVENNENPIQFEQSPLSPPSPFDREADAEQNLQVQTSTAPSFSNPVPKQFRFPELNIKKKSKKKTLLKSTPDTSATITPANQEAAVATPAATVKDRNAFKINSFKAEQFYNLDSNAFPGSNFSKLIGYGLTSDIKIEINERPVDTLKIRRLYGKLFDKYAIYREGGESLLSRSCTVKKMKKRSMFALQV